MLQSKGLFAAPDLDSQLNDFGCGDGHPIISGVDVYKPIEWLLTTQRKDGKNSLL
jgi:hypothetical protein